MQKMRVLQWVACFMLIVSLVVPNVAWAQTGGETVKVRLAGMNGLSYESFIKVTANEYTNTSGDKVKMDKPTAMGALVELAKLENLTYTAETFPFGVYLREVGGVKEKTGNPNTGWTFYVNGQPLSVSADQTEVHDGDVVTVAFVDWTQTLYPKVKFSTTTPQVGEEVTVTVTADKTTYDENFNATTTTVPVEGATVFYIHGVRGGSDAPMPKTDENGVVKMTPEMAGMLTVTVYKDSENGVAELINSGSMHMLVGNSEANFQDLNGYGWAKTYIDQLASKGIMTSATAGDSYFPGTAVSREELAELLALSSDLNIGGTAQFTDMQVEDPYIQTAARLGYMTGDAEGTFRPVANLKREEFAIVLTRFAGVQVTDATNATQLSFPDNTKISSWAIPYVKAAVASGLLVGDSAGTFRPQATLNRAEVATALAKVMNKQTK